MRSHIAIYIVAFALSGCSVAMADDIRARQYSYGYGDTVKAMDEDAFVVCGDCQLDKLDKLPVRQIVAIKINPPEPVVTQDQKALFPDVMPPETMQGEKAQAVNACSAQSACLDETVLFKFDSDKLQPSEKAKLNEIVSKVPTGASLTVTGYTCTIGTKEYNKKLSKRRADSVAAYLRGKGVNVSLSEGKGDCCPVSKDKKLNRRVEVMEKEKK